MERRVIQVEGMSCGHCKAAIEKAVRSMPGVVMVEVELARKEVVVEFDAEQVTLEAVKEMIDDTGFTVV
ncbi:copper ion binding protein [Azotosporobacter soli]|uniref:copper ion binding protein n=1 Tax=Azotosporobacter soli TaxID=3055040 RepID=UPI0031FEE8D3